MFIPLTPRYFMFQFLHRLDSKLWCKPKSQPRVLVVQYDGDLMNLIWVSL